MHNHTAGDPAASFASPMAEVLTTLQLFGRPPNADEPDRRPLPAPEALEAIVSGLFAVLPEGLAETRLEDDLPDLLWALVNLFHRRLNRIERDLDDNKQAQRRSQAEQDFFGGALGRTRAAHRRTEMGRITEWLQAVGLPVTGGERGSIGPTKDQLVRLSFPIFTMFLNGDDGGHVFKRESLIEGGAFKDDDLEVWASGGHSAMRWPEALMLSQNAYDRFTRHSIPVPTARLRQVAHNAMAIDILVYLCYRLPLLSRGESELLTWRDLMAQFGSSEFASRFKQAFSESIKRTLDAYPEANVAMTAEGLVLRHSEPAELRRAFVAVAGSLPRRARASPRPRKPPRATDPSALRSTGSAHNSRLGLLQNRARNTARAKAASRFFRPSSAADSRSFIPAGSR